MNKFVWKVLLVLDDTELADKATECAIDLFISGLSSKVFLFYCKDEEPVALPSEELEVKKYAPLIAKANKKILEAAEKLKIAGVDYEVLGFHIGIADEEIKRIEGRFVPDLIIIGAKRRSALRKLLGGSHYSEKVIFETKAPVIVVKPEYSPKIKEIVKEIPVIEAKAVSEIE